MESGSMEGGTTSQEVVPGKERLSKKGLTEDDDGSDGSEDLEEQLEAKEVEHRDAMDEMDPRDEQKRTYPADLELEKAELEEKYEEACDWRIRRIQPWKAPGPDGIHAHWWEALPSAKKLLNELVVDWLATAKDHSYGRKGTKETLSVAWLDFQKAYDSVSHEYIRWAINSVNIPRSVELTLRRLMSDWETRFESTQCRPKLRSDKMKMLNGIFQAANSHGGRWPQRITLAIATMRHVYSNTNGAAPKLLEALKRAATLDTQIRVVVGTCGEHVPAVKEDRRRCWIQKLTEWEPFYKDIPMGDGRNARVVRAHLTCSESPTICKGATLAYRPGNTCSARRLPCGSTSVASFFFETDVRGLQMMIGAGYEPY
uniref:Reverse transcriptase domain-containing protein n=1 Tax=Parascaris univalens TaxID=6257 RepID=A0A915B0T6_PARUN